MVNHAMTGNTVTEGKGVTAIITSLAHNTHTRKMNDIM